MQTTPAILALSLLEAVQNIDTPPDDGLGALEHELASKRLGLSATVAAQVARYRERAEVGGDLPEDEALAVFRLVGRRPDAALVYSDAGRRAARYAARREGTGSRTLRSLLPGKLAARLALRSAGRLARRWLLIELRADGSAQARAGPPIRWASGHARTARGVSSTLPHWPNCSVPWLALRAW